MLNPAQILILFVGCGVSIVTFLLMRYPSLRRSQFQGDRRFTSHESLLTAIALFLVFALIVWIRS